MRGRPTGLRAIPFILTLAALVVAPASAQERLGLWDPYPGPDVRDMRAGIEAYYRFDYDEAMRRFDAVVARHPRHPSGYFLLAEAFWWQFLNDRQNARARNQLERNLDLAIGKAEARLKSDPDDVESLFILGSAYGRKGMLAGTQKEKWGAARNARKAKRSLDRVRQLDGENVDALAAQGLYMYYVGTFGSVVRAASKILFGLEGDREAGLAALDQARREGTYTRTEAAFFQGLFYLEYEDRPVEAENILDPLRERYPENLYFATMAAYAKQRQRRFASARTLYEDVLARLADTRVYGCEGESITRYFYGQTLMALGALDEAWKEFIEVVRLGAEESDTYAHSYLHLGRLADLSGNHETARRYYRRVLSLPDQRESHDAARRYLEDPFRLAQVPLLVGGSGR